MRRYYRLPMKVTLWDNRVALIGGRACIVDGKPLNDYEVLELWWGLEIVDQIRQQRRHK